MAEIGSSEAPLDATTSSAPTAAGPLVPLRTYDVFLNHRGPDVKKGFVSHLVASLAAVGVRTFVDYEELFGGDEAWDAIESAIRHSKVHIAIFSRGYADSPWCLRELHEMLECHTTKCSQLFLPVFFNVAPSELRYPSSPNSCYSKAFAKLRKRNEPEVIKEWILALSHASMVIGRTFDSQGFEADLVKLIVSDVLQVLNPTALSIAKHPVGVDEKLQEALDLMKIHKVEQGLHILGIYGMGGVGKTTLAKAIYNRIHTNFDGFCFIESVRREVQTPRGLGGVQDKILHAVLKGEAAGHVSGPSHGKELLKNCFLGLKILIILDDIDNREQLEALVLPFEDCRVKDGSHLVITSRDRQVLIWAKAQQELFMEGLSEADANLFFNCHAFLRPEGPPEVLKRALAKKVVKACQGLPLALETLGAHLYGKDAAIWETTVKVLEGRHRMFPAQCEVTSILKISYEGLHSEEKKMFLDIACFMLGEHEDWAKRVWCESDASTLWLETLKMKCLVKLDQDGRLTMHDLLQDTGREIVECSHPNIWQRSHIWDETDAEDALRRQRKVRLVPSFYHSSIHEIYINKCLCGGVIQTSSYGSEVRALRMALGDQRQWNTKSFAGMDSLRFLVIAGKGNITGDFRLFPKELRWLQWHRCPWEWLPRKLDLSKVAVLDLEESLISSLSRNGHMFENLRELRLGSCRHLKELPDFRVCKKLEVLNLYFCGDLERVPESIGCLSSTLTRLDLSWCRKLTTLPDALGCLHCLKSLELDGCSSLTRLPDAIGQLTALEDIGLSGLKSLMILPQSLGNLTKLSELDLTDCKRLQELPSTLGNLRKLSSLSVSDTGIRETPAAVCSLTNLVDLTASYCAGMVSLPEEIGNLCNLKGLCLSTCRRLSHLPSSIGTLRDLATLNLESCNIGEGGLPKELGSLSSLRHLHLASNPLSRVPEHLLLLTGLHTLDVSRCHDLREIPLLPSSLKVLSANNCENLREIGMFPPSLIRWDTSRCPRLMRLPSLYPRDGVAHLEELDVGGCTGFSSSDVIEEFAGLTPSLSRLRLHGTGVSLGPWIEKLVSLEELTLDGDSLPECFIRCKLQEVHGVLDPRDTNVWHFEATVPHTGKGMECKGLVVCVAYQGSGSATHLRISAYGPGGELMQTHSNGFFFERHGQVAIFRLTRHPFLDGLKGGTILSFEVIELYGRRAENLEAAVRLVHADHEWEEILTELSRVGAAG